MFFPRLRRQAKWAFVFMVVVFALSFVFLGVGSGSGVGDLLSDRFGDVFGRTAGGPSIDGARKKVRENPRSAPAYRELATAYEAKQRNVEAIGALRRYIALRPKDMDAVQELASIQLARAENLRSRAAAAYAAQQEASLGQSFGPSPTSKLGQALGADPITQSLTTIASAEFNDLYSKTTAAYGDAVKTYKKLAGLQPEAATVQEELGLTAELAGDTKTAIAAYKRFLVLAPEDQNAAAIRQKIAQLRAQSGLTATGGGG